MKCIQHRQTGQVCRVSDEEALRYVTNGPWGYVTKSVWKSQRQKAAKPAVVIRTRRANKRRVTIVNGRK